MITNTPLLLSVLWASILSWINISSPLILFGLYYGFLTTLPIGPSQILSIRAFLLEGNLSGIIAVSGLILGQLIVFLSIYYSPFYILLLKPHTITLVVLPYILFYWYRIKDLLDYQSLRPLISINDNRIYKIFLDSFIFQLLNPVLLPSPILARLVNLFFFRYSNNFLFVLSCFFGWLIGHLFFLNFIKLLLIRIEQDSPVLYLLVKRVVYRTFSIIILAYLFLYLGRAPVPFFTKKLNYDSQINQLKTEKFYWLTKPWPTLFFDHHRWNRPLRYVENSRFNNKSPVKKKVSQYFFNICSNDGKQRISFTALPSLSIFENDLKNYLNISTQPFLSNTFYKNWINIKKKRKRKLYYELKNRIEALNQGFLIQETIEKKTGLSNNQGNHLTKIYDPLLNGFFRGKLIISKSPWLLIGDPHKLKKNKKILNLSKKNNKLKFWISNRSRELKQKNLALPWEPLNKDARRISILLVQGSKNKQIETNLQQFSFSEEQALVNLNKQNIFSDLVGNFDNTTFLKKKTTKTSHFNWELILNLSTKQRTLYFKRLEKEKWQAFERSWKNLFSKNLNIFTQIKKIPFLFIKTLNFHKKSQFEETFKEVPRWTSKLRNDKFDVIAIGVTDIRQRKVKNLGYLLKGKDKRRKIIRRFSQQSDFRRKLIKGSMRARRRKTLIWKVLQLKVHSPFFLRMNEKHISFQSSLSKLNLIHIKNIFLNSIEKQKKIIPFSKKNNFTVKKTKADRLAIANRWDFPLAQWGRSWLLIIQSHFRKYFLLPILIILKNVIRLILFQIPEWNQDWNEWNKEIHIKCTYDGTEVSEKELPEQWLRDGLQIKIIYPFKLKPWHKVQFRTNKKNIMYNSLINKEFNLIKNKEKILFKKIGKKKINYSYLTAWGFQTNIPFGNIKKQSSFWKPIRKELIKNLKNFILLKFSKFYFNIFFKKINKINNESNKLLKLDTKFNKSIKNSIVQLNNKSDINLEKNNKIINKLPINIKSKFRENFLLENQIDFELENITNLEKLETLISLKKKKIKKLTKKIFFNKIEFSNKSGKIYYNNDNRLESKKILIQIKPKIIKFCRKKIELIKKWLYLIKIILKKIDKNLKKISIDFIRFNIKLIIKIKQNFIFIRNKKLNNKKNKINNKYSNKFNEKIKSLKIKINQENILLISQTNLFHKIWQIIIINKYNCKYLLENWTPNLVINKKIKKDLKKKGILSLIKLSNIKEKNWKKWLQTFNKYNISSQIWYKLTPQNWKIKVSNQWKKRKKFSFNIFDKKNKNLISKKISYKFLTNSFSKETKKLNKRYKSKILCYSYLDSEKKLHFLEPKKKERNKFKQNYIENFQFNKEKNIFTKSNLLLWLVPNFNEKKNVTNISLLKENNKKNTQNRKSLRERERYQTIRQWKWKSKNIEKNFKELGDMASLMTFMQNQENSISLSVKMRENLNLFRLLFCRDIGINKLTINSEHRLPRVLDDQILMYKVVSLFFKSKIIFKKNSNLKKFNESFSRINLFSNSEKTNLSLFSVEDIMLPKHRKELKILNFLDLNKSLNFRLKFNQEILKKNKKKKIKITKIRYENKNLTIKRFLWPSFRLEDLACINRFWFNTNNGSRFTMLRIRMYILKSN